MKPCRFQKNPSPKEACEQAFHETAQPEVGDSLHFERENLDNENEATLEQPLGTAEHALSSVAVTPSLWFATCAKILTKDQCLITPDPNRFQLQMLQAYEWCIENAIPCRILALKPRQKGSSTVASAILYHHCRRFRTRAIQIADRHKNSDNLMAITGRYAESDAFPWASGTESNAASITFLHEGKIWSRISKDTAENPRAGRSGTYQALHVSEAAHFPNEGEKSADKTMLSLLNSLADVPKSVAIVETTANGEGGWFYEHWQGAVSPDEFLSGQRGNGWIKIFAPWFDFEDSSIPHELYDAATESPLPSNSELLERETRGKALYGWTTAQIRWRRWVLAQKCSGRADLFDQEYPEDEQSAFLTSGRPRFSIAALTRLQLMSSQAKAETGFLTGLNCEHPFSSQVTFESHASGWAQIWEFPREGQRYLLWCDTATGREQTKESRNPDRHAILVLKRGCAHPNGAVENPMLVARIRPPCFDDWHILQEKVIALSLYYGRCLIGVEVPMGLTLLEGLRKAGMPLFKRRSSVKPSSGDSRSANRKSQTNPIIEKLGFQSNSSTKPMVIASLSKALDSEPLLDIFDAHAVQELRSFVTHQDGREAALKGKHDDDVMALAMGVHHLELATLYACKKIPKPSAPADLNKWKPLHPPQMGGKAAMNKTVLRKFGSSKLGCAIRREPVIPNDAW
jgi:hypothetical protein